MTVAHRLRDIHFEGIDPSPAGRSAISPIRRRTHGAGLRTTGAEALERHDPLLDHVLRSAGLDPAAYRPSALQRRAVACARQLRARSVEDALRQLHQAPALAAPALNSVLIGVTEFFRDRPVFDDLARTAVPALLGARETARVLSVGVSTGEELYSMAILIAEAGGLERSTFVGIDCRADALRAARHGWYASVDGVDEARRCRWMETAGAGWRVRAELRDRTEWRVGDVFRTPLVGADLLLWRNVAIYLDARAAERAWRRLVDVVTPGGYVITGKAERPPAALGLHRVASCIYRKP